MIKLRVSNITDIETTVHLSPHIAAFVHLSGTRLSSIGTDGKMLIGHRDEYAEVVASNVMRKFISKLHGLTNGQFDPLMPLWMPKLKPWSPPVGSGGLGFVNSATHPTLDPGMHNVWFDQPPPPILPMVKEDDTEEFTADFDDDVEEVLAVDPFNGPPA